MTWPFDQSLTSSERRHQADSNASGASDARPRSCYSRPRSSEHPVCKKYREVRFNCNHASPATSEDLQWWESWDVCDICKYDEVPGRAEYHWTQRPNQQDDYEPGVKVAHYSCLDCWKSLIVPSKWNIFQAEWEPRLLRQDWQNIRECAQYHLAAVHPTEQKGRWCCRKATDIDHNPFYCQMESLLQEGVNRKIAVDQGWSGLDYKPLWVKPKSKPPLGTDMCIVS